MSLTVSRTQPLSVSCAAGREITVTNQGPHDVTLAYEAAGTSTESTIASGASLAITPSSQSLTITTPVNATVLIVPAAVSTEVTELREIDNNTDGLEGVLGTTTDVGVSTDAAGTLSAKIRGLIILVVNLLSRWPASLGQKAKASAFPVTLASDEDLLARIGEVQASPTANTVLDRLKAILTGTSLASSTAHVGQVGQDSFNILSDLAKTRPGNATPYAPHKALGDGDDAVFTFTNFFAKNGGAVLLSEAMLIFSLSGITVPTGIQVRGHFFNTLPASPPASDQADFATLTANDSIYLGAMDFLTSVIGGTGSDCFRMIGIPLASMKLLKAAAGSRDLFLVFESLSTWTPPNGAGMDAKLMGLHYY